MYEEEFFKVKKVTVSLGIRNYTTQTWRAWHVDGMFRVHGIFEGGRPWRPANKDIIIVWMKI